MPSQPATACREPRCHALLLRPGYCIDHAKANKQRSRQDDPGYGSAWKAIRAQVLREEPTCRACHQAPSTDCDHILPRSKGGTNQRANLQGLCHPCHVDKTARQHGGIFHAYEGQPEVG